MTDAEKNKDTQGLLDGRESTYGNVVDNAARVANIWNGYLGTDTITPADMMMMMALYKAYRFKVTPDYSDNINDVLGYAEIVRQVQEQTGGLIHAETVKEYLEKKVDIGFATVDRLMHDLASEAQANFHSDLDFIYEADYVETPAGEMSREDQIIHDLASEAQANFHSDYDETPADEMSREDQIMLYGPPDETPADEMSREDQIMLYGPPDARFKLQEERRAAAEHAAAEEEIKEGRRPPHLRAVPSTAERVNEAAAMDEYLRHRCGAEVSNSVCRLYPHHAGDHQPSQ